MLIDVYKLLLIVLKKSQIFNRKTKNTLNIEKLQWGITITVTDV